MDAIEHGRQVIASVLMTVRLKRLIVNDGRTPVAGRKPQRLSLARKRIILGSLLVLACAAAYMLLSLMAWQFVGEVP